MWRCVRRYKISIQVGILYLGSKLVLLLFHTSKDVRAGGTTLYSYFTD